MVGIIDYGVGNLFSLCSSLRFVGAEAVVSSDTEVLKSADRLLLPGVGAFGDAAKKLIGSGMGDFVKAEVRAGKPLLGVCLGMQLLFEKSFEYGEHEGLGLLKGSIVGMKGRLPESLKIPHMGWNALHIEREHPLLQYVHEGDCVYFVHSFYAEGCEDSLIASTEYGTLITAAVARENIMGCQFHPEKSGSVGLSILRRFCEMEVG